MWDFARELAELATQRDGLDRQAAVYGLTNRAKALWRQRYRWLDGRFKREEQPDLWGWEEFRRRLIRA